MTLLAMHIPMHREAILDRGLLQGPVLVLGFHETSGLRRADRSAQHPVVGRRAPLRLLARAWVKLRPAYWEIHEPDLVSVLRKLGQEEVRVLDLFDGRADYAFDLNHPIPAEQHDRYGTVFDLGTLEHVFDTRQALESCLRMVRPGGRYYLHTPVNGYFGHGLHTFNPEAIIGALQANDFEVEHVSYWSYHGERLREPGETRNALIAVRARKVSAMTEFRVPQQQMWMTYYS